MGRLEKQGNCYFLQGSVRRTIIWAPGTTFGSDSQGAFVKDGRGRKARVGETVALSGGETTLDIITNKATADSAAQCGPPYLSGQFFVQV